MNNNEIRPCALFSSEKTEPNFRWNALPLNFTPKMVCSLSKAAFHRYRCSHRSIMVATLFSMNLCARNYICLWSQITLTCIQSHTHTHTDAINISSISFGHWSPCTQCTTVHCTCSHSDVQNSFGNGKVATKTFEISYRLTFLMAHSNVANGSETNEYVHWSSNDKSIQTLMASSFSFQRTIPKNTTISHWDGGVRCAWCLDWLLHCAVLPRTAKHSTRKWMKWKKKKMTPTTNK